MPRTLQHPHKLRRHRYESTGNAIYFCILPDCNFKTEVKLTLGKRSICWRCGREFIMNENSIRLAKPHCNACTKKKTEELPVDEVLQPVAEATTDSLKDRLSKTVSSFQAKADEGGEL